MKKIYYLLLPAISMVIISCHKNIRYRRISEEEYLDKMKAAWVGQMAGVGWGGPTEFRYTGKIIPPDKIPVWNPELVNQFNQDDIYVELTFLHTLEEYGLEVPVRQAGIDFANTGYQLWAANYRGRENLREGIAPPESGHPVYSKNADDIDYQIEADYSGIIAPGLPQVPIDLGERFGRLMNYGDGLYGGQFIGGMYTAAYFEKNPEELIKAGLACIPDSSQYAMCVRDVLQWHREDPVNWERTWQKIEDKYYRNPAYQRLANEYKETWPDINAKINGAYVVMGLLYGNGDPDSTIVISTRGGRDSDCNPSSAAGVLFTTIGFKKLPERFKSALKYHTVFSYSDYDFSALMEVSQKLARENIQRAGGKVVIQNGDAYYEIPVQKPRHKPLHQSWEPGPYDPENHFTPEEMAWIKAYPVKAYDTIMTDFAPGWEVLFAGKSVRPGLITWGHSDHVLITAPMSSERGVMIRSNTENTPVTVKSILHIIAGAVPGKDWKLRVIINWETVTEVVIGDENKLWEQIDVDLADFAGKNPGIQLMADNMHGKLSNNYWKEIRISN